MRVHPIATAGLAGLATLLLTGGAYAAVQSVDTSPEPQVVIPARPAATTVDDHGRRHGGHRVDDPLSHDAGDDHGRRHGGHGADD